MPPRIGAEHYATEGDKSDGNGNGNGNGPGAETSSSRGDLDRWCSQASSCSSCNHCCDYYCAGFGS